MELLAPAGTKENFMAALDAGADAIYLGGKVFNARARAGNFSIDVLEECVALAHSLGVAVYVTVNILVGDSEMKDLRAYIKELDRIKVDAVIVQDLGVASVVREVSSRLAIHGSTQMTASNLATVDYLYELGFSRVVLSRELSLEEITYICQHTKAEIEVFIHGALCISYSGQCLMSSFIGGRSGNRGACAQPCRLPYELVNGKGESLLPQEQNYIMSPKDLNYAEYMDKLIEGGVHSFKVEGRMKKVSYVKEIIGAYRHIIDQAGKALTEDKQRLEKGFNRGFSQDYLKDTPSKKMMTVVAPNNQGERIGKAEIKKNFMEIQTSKELVLGDLVKIVSKDAEPSHERVDESWTKLGEGRWRFIPKDKKMAGTVYLAASQKEESHSDIAHLQRKYPLYAYLDGREGEAVSLTMLMEDGRSVTVTNDYILQKANTRATTQEVVEKQLGRLGNSIFTLASVSMPEGDFMWPASVLNAMRREAVEHLEKIIISDYGAANFKDYAPLRVMDSRAKEKVSYPEPAVAVLVDSMDGVRAAVENGATIIHFGMPLRRKALANAVYKEVVDYCRSRDVYVVLTTPRIVRQKEVSSFKTILTTMVEAKPHAIGVHFLGALLWLDELGFTGEIWAETGLNIFNSEAMAFLAKRGIYQGTFSLEATANQMAIMEKKAKALSKEYGRAVQWEAMVQGRVELMVTEYCPISSFAGIGKKENCPGTCMKDSYYLRDRKGELFPIMTDPQCRVHIMNNRELDMKPYGGLLLQKDVTIWRIDGRNRDTSYVAEEVQAYVHAMSHRDEITPKEDFSVTRGHFFKGI